MVRTLTLTNPTATIHRHIDRLHTTGARVLLTHTYRERERKREKEQNMIMVQKKLMMIMMAALLAACALATSATAMNTIPTNLVLRKLSQWGGEWSYEGPWGGEWSGCWGDCGSSDDYYGDWYDPYGVDTDDDYYRGNDGYFYQYSGRRF